jgi:hypothetical protein
VRYLKLLKIEQQSGIFVFLNFQTAASWMTNTETSLVLTQVVKMDGSQPTALEAPVDVWNKGQSQQMIRLCAVAYSFVMTMNDIQPAMVISCQLRFKTYHSLQEPI